MSRYEKLCSIIDDVKVTCDQDTDVYAEAVVALFESPEFRDSLAAVVDYSWPEEERDYENMKADGEDVTDHVFVHIKRLQDWLIKTRNV